MSHGAAHLPASLRALRCVVVTPERALVDETVDFVAVPMYDGELGVLPGRAPLIGRLGFGELRLRRGDLVQRFYVDGGFAQVRDDVVSVLTARAVRAEEVNVEAAQEALHAPLAPGAVRGAAAAEARLKAQERARAQLRVVRHAEGGQAQQFAGGH
jgi:F-type H+-transporting ATPase subunit epsilon